MLAAASTVNTFVIFSCISVFVYLMSIINNCGFQISNLASDCPLTDGKICS